MSRNRRRNGRGGRAGKRSNPGNPVIALVVIAVLSVLVFAGRLGADKLLGSDSQTSVTNWGTVSEIPGSGVPDFSLAEVPAYSGSPYAAVNGNVPYFTEEDRTTDSFEYYSELDSLGRCGTAYANVSQDTMPTEERGSIGEIRPSGWHSVRYDGVDGGYLYNRCHLIAHSLTGEDANERNLITGTRYLNTEGMLPFEEMTADYVKETGNHVLYRVTPVFEGDNLVASGVLMEAESVEDDGAGIEFCVYCYNVQPGVTIDYSSGESSGPAYTGS